MGRRGDITPHSGSPGLQTANRTTPLRVVLMRALLEALMRRFKGFCTKVSEEDFRPRSSWRTGPFPSCSGAITEMPSSLSNSGNCHFRDGAKASATSCGPTKPANLIRFFSLKTQAKTTGVTPWKIQPAMRNDQLMYEMRSLIGSAIWMLVAGRLKAHSQQRSRAVQEIQDIAYPRRQGNRRH